jgi:hypothetical protein
MDSSFPERPDTKGLPEPDEFFDYQEQATETLTAELPQITVQIDAAPSRWKKLRGPLSLILVLVALCTSLAVLRVPVFSKRERTGSSKSVLRRYPPSARTTTSSTRTERRPKAMPIPQAPPKHVQHKLIKRIHSTRGHRGWAPRVAGTPQVSVDEATAPSRAPRRRERSRSEFIYLGR